jgi:polysaccharide deacetylase family protein (PEP-CTERM system associated)
MARDVLNALCVDADDLASNLHEAGWSVGERVSEVAPETHALLEALAAMGLHATFFVPGHFVEVAPELVAAMAEAGHQVASHGTRHCPVASLSRAEFLEDVRRSKGVLEDLVGRPVDTYKAPIWSITPGCVEWAYDALLEAGFRVDHSAMPRVVEHLGRPRGEAEPFVYGGGLVVVPVTALPLPGYVLPLPGGFYNAWCPFAVQRRLYDRLNARKLPFNFYFHPFEHSPAPAKRRLLKNRSFWVSLYAAHAGRYQGLLRRVAERYELSTLEKAYARWLGRPA